MTNLIIHDLEHNEVLDDRSMARISGGNRGLWVFGWINPYSASGAGTGSTNFYNSVFNIQVTNQTINGGSGPINAINMPISAPSTVLNENLALTSIESTVLNAVSGAG